jgi:hypothetical protein
MQNKKMNYDKKGLISGLPWRMPIEKKMIDKALEEE